MAITEPTTNAVDGLSLGADDLASQPERRRTVGYAVGAVLLLLLVTGGAYALGFFDDMIASAFGTGTDAVADDTAIAGAKAATITFYELPDLVVSLNTNERKSTFLKVRVTLELADPTAAAAVERMLPRIIDHCQVYLRELRPDDLRGSAGTLRLREELRRRIATAIAPAEIRDVLFVELLVQ